MSRLVSQFSILISHFFLGLVAAVIVAAGLMTVFTVHASSPSDITFPVAELGNCKDKAACKVYCDQPENKKACVDFAERHGLLSREEALVARRVVEVETGPGGCKSHTECEIYCDDENHIDECLEFAEREGVLSGEELEEARRVSAALRSGNRLPGGCKSKAACAAYCTALDHLAECLAFAEVSGLIAPDELAEAKKVLKAVQAGHAPPGSCQSKRQCEAYCNDPAHMEECLEFGLAAGFLDPEDAEEARRVLPLLKSGQTPGKCKSKQQCEAYCFDPNHLVECTEFAVKAGFIPPEEAAMLKKVLPFLQAGQTPGKCRSKEQCEAYCGDPAHRQECTEFALKAGIMSPEDLRQMEEGMERMREHLAEAPEEVRVCIEKRLGAGVVAQIEAGTLSPGFDTGEHFRECFDQFAPRPEFDPWFRDCLVEKLGEGAVSNLESGDLHEGPTPAMEAAFRSCDEARRQADEARHRSGRPDDRGPRDFEGEGDDSYGDEEYIDEGEYDIPHDPYVDGGEFESDEEPESFEKWRERSRPVEGQGPHSSSLLRRVVRSRPEPKIVRFLKTLLGRETVWGR